MLELIGASGYPRQLDYAPSLNARLGAFCDREKHGCTNTARLELAELAHETEHMHSGWVPAYPRPSPSPSGTHALGLGACLP